MTTKRSLSHIPSLDGIRALAALMVMVFHFVGHHGEPASLIHASVLGQTGVDLFFVLSGFLITRILLNSKDSPNYFSSFYARRALRIFPLYYAFLAFYFFVLPLLLQQHIPSFASQSWSWFYLQNVPATFDRFTSSGPSHFWSLAVEEHFYLVWPLMVFLLSRRQFKCLLVATLLLPPLLRFAFLSHGVGVFYFTPTRMDSIGYGAVLAVVFMEELYKKRGVILLLRCLLVGLPLILLPLFIRFSGSQQLWLQVIKLTLIPMFYFSLIGFCIMDPASQPLTRIFSIRLLALARDDQLWALRLPPHLLRSRAALGKADKFPRESRRLFCLNDPHRLPEFPLLRVANHKTQRPLHVWISAKESGG